MASIETIAMSGAVRVGRSAASTAVVARSITDVATMVLSVSLASCDGARSAISATYDASVAVTYAPASLMATLIPLYDVARSTDRK